MFVVDAVLALAPLLLIFYLILIRRMAADLAGVLAWFFCGLLACLYFGTSVSVVLAASLSGLVASLPVALSISFGMLLVAIMVEAGAMGRIAALLKSVAPKDKSAQILLICCGGGIVLTTVGAGPFAMIPAILVAVGYPAGLAILLTCAGFAGGCTFALLATPAQVLAAFCDVSLAEVGYMLAWLMPVTNICMALVCLWAAGRGPLVREGVIPACIMGGVCTLGTLAAARLDIMPLAGFVVGVGIMLGILLYLRARGHPLIDRSPPDGRELAAEKRIGLAAALAPWSLMLLFGLLVHMPSLPLHGIIRKYPVTLHIIPDRPEHLRLFTQTYFWLLVSIILSLPFLRVGPRRLGKCLKTWAGRAPRPFVACSVYFAIAYVFTHSGKDAAWLLKSPDNNMIAILASAAAGIFGQGYAIVAPFMGLAAGSLTGSQTAGIAMLTELHIKTAAAIDGPGAFIAVGSAMGAGIAGILSPAKLMSAAASIGAIGEENAVLRSIILIGLGVTLILAVNTLIVCLVMEARY